MARYHLQAMAKVAGSSLVGVAEPNRAVRENLLRNFKDAAGFDTFEDLLKEGRPDVVHICTPPATHAQLTRAALQAGCHVYVEKPFVESSSAAAELIQLAEAKGLKVCAGHQLLFESPTLQAQELLPALGKIVAVESYFSFRTVRLGPDGRAPLRPDLQLLDILPHPVYLLLHFLRAANPGATARLTGLEVGSAGTVHGLVRCGDVTGSLTVTLEGRPIESFVRIIGTNGSLYADYVRSIVNRSIGPGSSGIDKLFAPYGFGYQLFMGTTVSMTKRVIKKQTSYPGLAEIFEAFYHSARTGGPSPVSPASIQETVNIWEQVAAGLGTFQAEDDHQPADAAGGGGKVLVTGGTGFLGKELVRVLVGKGQAVRVLARRKPAKWERIAGVEYIVADISQPLPDAVFQSVDAVIHCAAATAGAWAEHQKNSLDATEHILRGAAKAKIRKVIHVSSLAVLASAGFRGALHDESPLDANSRSRGPYVWGKLESEKLAIKLGEDLGLPVKVSRPAAIVDYRNFDPPGRLGKRIGNFFVAVGNPGSKLGVVDLEFAANALAWMAANFEGSPAKLNLLAPELPTRKDLVSRLRKNNPDLKVIWIPSPVLWGISTVALALQKILKPRKPAVNVAKVFSSQAYDTSRIAGLTPLIEKVKQPA
jgi:predicted dehydrogenase/nucleoside-diphosphate-sugar epimerase